jgi:hypothetical protein
LKLPVAGKKSNEDFQEDFGAADSLNLLALNVEGP